MKTSLFLALIIASSSLFAQNKIVGYSGNGRYGDANSGGTIFESNPDGTGFTVLKNFAYDRIGRIYGELVKGPDDQLYGISSVKDGHLSCLFFFKIESSAGTLTVLHKFEGFSQAIASPVWGHDGFFYFCAVASATGQRMVMRIAQNGQDSKVLANIPAPPTSYKGGPAYYKLHLESAGTFLMILPGNRLVRFVAGASALITVKQFDETADGTLYSITPGGNGNIYGTVTKYLPPITWKVNLFTIKSTGSNYALVDTDPVDFNFGDVKDFLLWDDSIFYVRTSLGFANTGIVKFNRNTNRADLIHSIYNNEPGKLVKSNNGEILFTAPTSIWKADPNGNYLSKIAQLNLASSEFTRSQLYEMSDGRLYFATSKYDYERVLSVKANGAEPTTNFTFNQQPSAGATPTNLIKGSDGNYYGTVRNGGLFGQGYIFTMTPDGNGFVSILDFNKMHMFNILHDVFFEGSDGNLYFGIEKEVLENTGSLSWRYELHSIRKDGSNHKTLISNFPGSMGVVISTAEGVDGKLYWIDGFWISRMNKDGTEKELNWKKLYQPDDEYNREGRLVLLPNGCLFGGIDYYYDNCTGSVCIDEWLSFFLRPDGTTEVKFNMKSQSFVPSGNDKVQNYDFVMESSNFSQTPTGYTVCPANLSPSSLVYAQNLTTDHLLWGNRAYNDGRYDLVAVSTDDKDCSYNIFWKQEMGYNGQFAFERGVSTATYEADLNLNVKISPNPVLTTLHVEIPNSTEPFSWQLFDVSGKIRCSGLSEFSVFEVEMGTLPPGFYQLSGMEGKNGARFSQKVVKVK